MRLDKGWEERQELGSSMLGARRGHSHGGTCRDTGQPRAAAHWGDSGQRSKAGVHPWGDHEVLTAMGAPREAGVFPSSSPQPGQLSTAGSSC